MCFAKNACPVPFDQQPLNEFYALQENGLFSFFGLRTQSFINSLFIIICIFGIVITPLVLAIFPYSLFKFLVLDLIFITFALVLVLIRLYLGWSYVIQRLLSATVFYEESGWYDGQIWIKTPEMLIKDRLIGTYYILPLLQRIRFTFLFLLLVILIEFICYSLLC